MTTSIPRGTQTCTTIKGHMKSQETNQENMHQQIVRTQHIAPPHGNHRAEHVPSGAASGARRACQPLRAAKHARRAKCARCSAASAVLARRTNDGVDRPHRTRGPGAAPTTPTTSTRCVGHTPPSGGFPRDARYGEGANKIRRRAHATAPGAATPNVTEGGGTSALVARNPHSNAPARAAAQR